MFKKVSILLVGLLVSTSAFGISSDPLEIGVGARPLGMGRAYVAMPDNFLINPSSISKINGLNLTSMSGKILQEVNYVTVGIANPFSFGTLALGYIGSGIGSIPITRMVGNTVETYDSTDYSNNVIVLSYATPVNSVAFMPSFDIFNDVSVGTSLKLYSQGFSNTTGSMEGATGSGMDMDMALSYTPDAPYSVGLNLQNALPASMGGKFTWKKNNVEEGIAAVLKVGGALKILGQNALRQLGDHDLTLALDLDNYISSTKPSVYHVGLEWWPVQMFALRLGIDQQSSTAQVNNDLTAGAGVKYSGFTFDYAYHQYGDVSDNTTHYFSMGYIGGEEKPTEIVKLPVAEKKLKTFRDVPNGYWAKYPIEYLATAGVIGGYPDGTFKPEKALSRAELCTLLIKAKGTKISKPTSSIFPDLPANHWAAPYVAAAVSQKLVLGYPDGTFKPKKSLTRAEAVKIIASFDGLKTPKATVAPFPDVPTTHWAAPFIQAAKQAGLLQYLKGKNFEPNKRLSRAEAAEMIFKTGFVKKNVKI